ncbi:MAG: hypothetical protein LBL45_11290 [Treponema sp.]|nr:hypothetical protein [Treponema sp.]
MKNKKILFFGVALILLALVAGVAFAQSHYGELNGVTWLRVEGRSPLLRGPEVSGTHHIQLQNHNSYAVKVFTSIGQQVNMKAGEESRHVNCFRDTTVTNVARSY